MSPRLWKVARSITGTALEGSPGIRSCSSQRLKMSASTLASVNPTHNKTPAGSAPMTLTRPLAFQSCCPGQPRGSLVHAVHTHRCAACHGQNHSRRYRQWAGHRAHKHQSFPETPAARPGLLSGASGLFICHARFAKRLPYGLRCHIKPRSAIVLAGVGMVYHLLRKLLRVDLSDLSTLAGPGSNPPGPTLDRSNANRKPLRGFSKAQAFLLSDRKNMPTKGYRICHNK